MSLSSVAYICLRREGPCVSGHFGGLPEVSELFFFPVMYFISFKDILCLKNLFYKEEYFISEEIAIFPLAMLA